MKQLLTFTILFLIFHSYNSLAQNLNLKPVFQTGHAAFINDIVLSPDGKLVGTVAADKVLKIWDATNGRLIKTISNFKGIIYTLSFSPDGKTVGLGFFGNVIFLDFESGKTLKDQYTGVGQIKNIVFSADSKRVLVTGTKKTATLWNSQTFEKIKEFTLKEDVYGADISSDGKYIALAASNAYNTFPIDVSIYNAKTFELIKNFTGDTDALGCIRFSPDSKTLAIQHKFGKEKIQFWDTESWTIKVEVSNALGGQTGSFNHDGTKYIVPNGYGNSFETIDTKTGLQIKKYKYLNSTEVKNAIFDPSGNYAYIVAGLQVDLWDLNKSKKLRSFTSGISNEIHSISLSEDERYLAVGGGDHKRPYLKVWDLQKAKIAYSYKAGKDKITSVSFNQENERLFAGDENSKGYVYELGKENFTQNIFQGALNTAISPDGKYMASGGKSVLESNSYRHEVYLYRLSRLNPASMNPPIIKSYFTDSKVKSLAFTPNGKYLAVATGMNGIILSLPDLKPVFTYPEKKAVNAIGVSKDSKYIAVGEGFGNNKIWDIEQNKVVTPFKSSGNPSKLVFHPDNSIIAIAHFTRNTVELRNVSDGKLIRELKHDATINDVIFNKEGSRIYTASTDQTIKIWNTNDGSLVMSLAGIGEEDYAFITPDNYYKISKNAIQGLHFVSGSKAISFDNFDAVYNRPDIVIQRLGVAPALLVSSYKKAVDKRLSKLGFKPNEINTKVEIPEIKILEQNIPIEISNKEFSFSIKAKDKQYSLDRLNLYINGIPVYGSKGKSLKNLQKKEYQEKLDIILTEGINTVQVSVHNAQGFESIRESFQIIYNVEKQPNDLYVIAIGVSDYTDDAFDLNYAAKDAEDLSNLLSGRTKVVKTLIPPTEKEKKKKKYKPQYTYQTVSIYKKQHVFKFLNADATKEKILAVKDALMKSSPGDEVVLFVAGHGLLDENLNYYFGTHDIDFENPSERGLAYEDLEGLLDGIPARKKLMLIDACHSGEVDKDAPQISENTAVFAQAQNVENGAVKFRGFKKKKSVLGLQNSFELMQELFADLRKGTGAMVISSASGAEFAYESPEWSNGVFTYSILEGLKNKKCDPNDDQKVNVSELKNYVSKRVTELTNGMQHPTSRRINLDFDFVIW